MNTPALAPVLPNPLPNPMPGPAPASAAAAGEPGAFARELQSASQPKAPAADADKADKAETPPSDDRPDAAGGREGESGVAAAPTGQARASAQRATLERWLAMARAGAADRGGAASDADTTTDTLASDAERTLAARAASDDEATAPEAAALLAALLPRPAEDTPAAKPSGGAGSEAAPAARSIDNTPPADTGQLGAGSPLPSKTTAELDGQDAAVVLPQPIGEEAAMARSTGIFGSAPGVAREENRLLKDFKVQSTAGDTGDIRDPHPGAAARDETAGLAQPAAALATAASPLPSFAAELARAGQAAAGGSHAASPAPAELRLSTPVTAPDFVPRLSGELAVLARDGVQEARVQVNPLELGPIAVQITLDGTAAQVRLAVDSAQTRELLEQGMPSLAAALRENGLTLTGGGVFQQPRGQGRDGQGSDTPSGRGGEAGRDDEADAVAAAAAPRRMRHPGQVDVFA